MERYVLEAPKEVIEEAFNVESSSEVIYEPNYNVMQGAVMPVIIEKKDQRVIEAYDWGYQKSQSSEVMAVLKVEDVELGSNWDEALEKHACIIPASGFYKWKETVEDPLPFYLRLISDEVSAFAGVYSVFEDDKGRTVKTFAILTMPANALVEPLDDRMPVILNNSNQETWLKGGGKVLIEKGIDADALLPNMTVFRVPELVNDPSNNSKELIQPIPKLRNYDGVDVD